MKAKGIPDDVKQKAEYIIEEFNRRPYGNVIASIKLDSKEIFSILIGPTMATLAPYAA